MARAVLLVVVLAVVCHRASSVELPCTTDADCDTEGATCQDNSCSCAKGQIMTSDLTRCLDGASEWGSVCSDAVQCVSRLLVGGTCSRELTISTTLPTDPARDVCQCAKGYHYLRGQCWRSVGLGGTCSRPESCYVNHDSESVTCSEEKRCVCAAGFYMREYSSCRRISTAFGQECGIAQDCQFANSDCVNRLCACRDGYAFDKDTKLCKQKDAARTASETYSQTRELHESPEAVGRTFRFHRKEGTPTAGTETECAADSDCGSSSSCESGRCVCGRGYYKIGSDTACHPEVLQACAKDSDCKMSNAICRMTSKTEGLCSCKGGYVASEDKRLCRKMSRALEWSCLYDEQCGYFGPGATCDSKRCRCSPGTHWEEDQKYCWVSKKVGEACQAAEDCATLGQGGSCSDGACTCLAGYHASADAVTCRVNAEGVGAACELDEDCVTENTACTAGACACVRGYMTDDTGKGCQSGVGGPCSKDVDCGALNSACVGSKCACPQARLASLAGDACLPVVDTLNGTCLEAAQCSQLRADCTAGMCQCAEEQHFRDGRCNKKRELGERCTTTSECFLEDSPERSECRNSVCRCGFAFTTSEDGTFCSSAGRATLAVSVASLWLAVCLSLTRQ